MTRDELVQAAIEALDAADITTYVDNRGKRDVVDGMVSKTVRVVVDTVLAKLAGMADLNIRHADGRPVHVGKIVVERVTLSVHYEE